MLKVPFPASPHLLPGVAGGPLFAVERASGAVVFRAAAPSAHLRSRATSLMTISAFPSGKLSKPLQGPLALHTKHCHLFTFPRETLRLPTETRHDLPQAKTWRKQ